jgi:hypothetical protein
VEASIRRVDQNGCPRVLRPLSKSGDTCPACDPTLSQVPHVSLCISVLGMTIFSCLLHQESRESGPEIAPKAQRSHGLVQVTQQLGARCKTQAISEKDGETPSWEDGGQLSVPRRGPRPSSHGTGLCHLMPRVLSAQCASPDVQLSRPRQG